jgi:hypothetical protein
MEEDESPYCPICDGCGEDPCCSAAGCKFHPDGYYCRTYLKNLKFGYLMYDSLMKLLDKKNIPFEDEEYNAILDKNYKLIYNETT